MQDGFSLIEILSKCLIFVLHQFLFLAGGVHGMQISRTSSAGQYISTIGELSSKLQILLGLESVRQRIDGWAVWEIN